MTEDEPFSSSAGLTAATDLLLALEKALGPDDVHVVAECGSRRWAAISDDSSEMYAVVVEVTSTAPLDWVEISRHPSFGDADGPGGLSAISGIVDEHAAQLPVSSADAPQPVILLPCRNGLELLYWTGEQVGHVTELFTRPGHLESSESRWSSFSEAIETLTWEP